jgi:hypothetical protein
MWGGGRSIPREGHASLRESSRHHALTPLPCTQGQLPAACPREGRGCQAGPSTPLLVRPGPPGRPLEAAPAGCPATPASTRPAEGARLPSRPARPQLALSCAEASCRLRGGPRLPPAPVRGQWPKPFPLLAFNLPDPCRCRCHNACRHQPPPRSRPAEGEGPLFCRGSDLTAAPCLPSPHPPCAPASGSDGDPARADQVQHVDREVRGRPCGARGPAQGAAVHRRALQAARSKAADARGAGRGRVGGRSHEEHGRV